MHALIVTAYRNYPQLYESSKLLSKYFHIFIHIDKKSEISDVEIGNLNQINNITVIKEYNIIWGSYKHILAVLSLLRVAQDSGVYYKYYHIISGEDLIIKSPEEIYEFFDENYGKNYIEMTPVISNPKYKKRYSVYYFNHIINYHKKLYKPFTKGLTVIQFLLGVRRRGSYKYKGLIWCSLTDQAVDNLLRNEYLSQYIKNLKYCLVPEEFFFQNIFLGTKIEDTIINDNLRYQLWDVKGRQSPAVLNVDDFNNIINSNKMFARKIQNYGVSLDLYKKILNKID